MDHFGKKGGKFDKVPQDGGENFSAGTTRAGKRRSPHVVNRTMISPKSTIEDCDEQGGKGQVGGNKKRATCKAESHMVGKTIGGKAGDDAEKGTPGKRGGGAEGWGGGGHKTEKVRVCSFRPYLALTLTSESDRKREKGKTSAPNTKKHRDVWGVSVMRKGAGGGVQNIRKKKKVIGLATRGGGAR